MKIVKIINAFEFVESGVKMNQARQEKNSASSLELVSETYNKIQEEEDGNI